jgi:hypothetical protein
MAPHTGFAALLVVAAFEICYGPPTLAQTIVEAKNWGEAIFKLECKQITKNADGSFSVKAIVKVNSEAQRNPIINVPTYTAEIEAKNCRGPGGLVLQGAGS